MSSPSASNPLSAATVAAGPLLLLVGLLWHPFIPDLTDSADVARHLEEDTFTWLGAHYLVAFGAAVLLLGFLAVRAFVRTARGPEPWTGRAVAPLVLGSCLFVMLPAMEIAMLAVVEAGGDSVATQQELQTWFLPTLVAGSILYGVGAVLFAVGVLRAQVLSTGLSWVVLVAFVVSALGRFVPMTLVLIISMVALNVAMLPLAAAMLRPARGGVGEA